MPQSDQYPPWVGLVYVFNLIVGTGALTLPAAFANAGWLFSTLALIVLCFVSFVTVTFVIESMACANATIQWRKIQEHKVDINFSSTTMNPQREVSTRVRSFRIIVNANQHHREPHRPEAGRDRREGDDNPHVQANSGEPREVLYRQQARHRRVNRRLFAERLQPLMEVDYGLPPGQEFRPINIDSDGDIFDRETVYIPPIQVREINSTTPDLAERPQQLLLGMNYGQPSRQEFHHVNNDPVNSPPL